jgi:uncharacterized protein
MNQAALLYNLQLLDTRISLISQKLKQIDSLINEDQLVQNAKIDLDKAKNQLLSANITLNEIEAKVKTLQIKIELCTSSLYGGTVKNPKELQDLQSELVSLKHRMSTLEDLQLESMLIVEGYSTERDNKENLYNKSIAENSEQKASLRGEMDQLKKNLDNLYVEREAVSGSISRDNLEIYESLKLKKRGIAVAKNEDTSCSACGSFLRPSEIQTTRSSNSLTFCATCGRIIFSE